LTGRPYRRSCYRQDPARTLHATYGETIRMALDVFERIAADGGFGDISRFFDHAETVTQASLDQIKALGGSVSVQNRMMFQGRAFAGRYHRSPEVLPLLLPETERPYEPNGH